MSGNLNVDYGNTPTGFVPKRLADIVEDIKAKIEAIVDPVTGESPQIDENDGSAISQLLGIMAEQISNCWQAAAMAAQQFDPLLNTGAGQSGTVQLNGILRRAAVFEVRTFSLVGTAGTVVAAGSIIGTPSGDYQFTTNEAVTLTGGADTVNGTRSDPYKYSGATGLTTGEVNTILTPIAGWTSAVDTYTPVAGEAEETDAELRERQQKSTSYTAGRHVEALYDAVTNVEGVTFCRVFQNNTMETDGRGIPAKSIAVVVVGGTDQAVAEAIFDKAPLGIGYSGNLGTPIVFTDSNGETYTVDFWRPTPVEIHVSVDITQIDSTYPSTGLVDIKQAIIDYAARGAQAVGAGSNFDRNGFPAGESVILTQLYTPINSVPGHKVNTLQIGKGSDPLGTGDITIEWNESATFDAENIEVTKT